MANWRGPVVFLSTAALGALLIGATPGVVWTVATGRSANVMELPYLLRWIPRDCPLSEDVNGQVLRCVWLPLRPLPAGHKIEAHDVALMYLPQAFVPDHANPVGRTTRVPIPKGAFVTPGSIL